MMNNQDWLLMLPLLALLHFDFKMFANNDSFMVYIPYSITVLTSCLLWLDIKVIPQFNAALKTWKIRKKCTNGLWCVVLLPALYASQFYRDVPDFYFECGLLTIFMASSFVIFISLKCFLMKSWNIIYFILITNSILMLLSCSLQILDTYESMTIFLIGIPAFLFCVNKILTDFQSSFSIGEAVLVSQCVVLFVMKFISSQFSQLVSDDGIPLQNDLIIINDIIDIGGLACLIVFAIFYWFDQKYFLQITLCTFLFLVFPFLFWTHKFAFIWIYFYIFSSPIRIFLIFFWASLLGVAIMVLNINLDLFQSKTIKRKIFHALIVLVYTPGIILDPELIYFASSVVLMLFVLIECIRISKDSPSANVIQKSIEKFLDEKDQGFLVLTHVYLLIGCSFPVWLSPNFSNSSSLPKLAGIISLGIGDTFASICGTNFGKHKWSGSPKTIEGTLCSIISMGGFIAILLYLGYLNIESFNILRTSFAVIFTALLEAKTNQVDNLVLPLYMFTFL